MDYHNISNMLLSSEIQQGLVNIPDSIKEYIIKIAYKYCRDLRLPNLLPAKTALFTTNGSSDEYFNTDLAGDQIDHHLIDLMRNGCNTFIT
ncbi:hypothetical protein LJC58_01885 [Lachnospiraceae bacterium OttesenSCG-928-D06]|nr:hypothetical protein [Lachnospiraceae bacterium OttesenSCG-928-D06]